MADVNLEWLRRLCESATHGPWAAQRNGDRPDGSDRWYAVGTTTGMQRQIARIMRARDGADAEFIAASRDALPSLLDEVERLRKAAIHAAQAQAGWERWRADLCTALGDNDVPNVVGHVRELREHLENYRGGLSAGFGVVCADAAAHEVISKLGHDLEAHHQEHHAQEQQFQAQAKTFAEKVEARHWREYAEKLEAAIRECEGDGGCRATKARRGCSTENR